MDFQYHYTPNQERFRAEVEDWLDENVPQGMSPAVCRNPSAAEWPGLQQLRLLLGRKGWLAPQEPVSRGGLGATQGEEVVLAEELGRCGLDWLQDPGTAALRQALHSRATQVQIDEFLGPVNRGESAVWHTHLDPDDAAHWDDIGVAAYEDGDDYVLNGLERFVGTGPQPDLLWALVRLCQERGEEPLDSGITFSCLVPANLEGISYAESRRLHADGPRPIVFDQVRVPRYYLLGLPGEGAWLMQTAIADAPADPAPHRVHPETASLTRQLLDFAEAVNDPDRQDVLLQLVMDAYVDCRVSRLFRLRDAHDRQHGGTITYQRAQTRLWESRAAKRLSEAAAQILGPYSLLDKQDPRTPSGGGFEAQQRGSLARNSSNDHWLIDRNTVARYLGMVSGQKAQQPPTSIDRHDKLEWTLHEA